MVALLVGLIPVSVLALPGGSPSRDGWVRLPAPPARAGGALVWTGRELVAWGGSYAAGGPRADGALYDAAAGRWRLVPPGPLRARERPAVAWTGSQVIIWGGEAGRRRFADGAELEPQSLTWTRLPPAPLSPRVPAAWAWTGSEFLVWGDVSRSEHRRDGAAYDPRRRTWRVLPRAPFALNQVSVAASHGEQVIYGSWLDGGNHSRTPMAVGLAYAPASDRWRVLPRFQLSPQASSVAVAGAQVLAWDYVLGAGLYDPVANRWARVRRLPLAAAECYPASATVDETVIAWYCGQGAVFDVRSRRWSRLPAPRRGLAFAAPVAAGSRALFLGRPDRGGAPELWAYTP